MRFIAFDVETPNYANHRMSAIGVAVLEDGEIKDQFYSLINPQTHFDSFNISLTGITPFMVRRSPTFPQIWEKIRPWMESGILAAHNAPFDLSVLAKCLRDYEISWRPTVSYVCTCQMGRRLLPELPNHRLDTMAAHFSFDLDHHNAMSDTLVCARLLQTYLADGAQVERFLRTYDLDRMYTF